MADAVHVCCHKEKEGSETFVITTGQKKKITESTVPIGKIDGEEIEHVSWPIHQRLPNPFIWGRHK